MSEPATNSPDLAYDASTLGASPSANTAQDAPPDLPTAAPRFALEGYELLEEIHRGGQGVVYRAINQSTGREVAIKVTRAGALATQSDRDRFEREARILGQLNHANIVGVHASGATQAGVCYFVMNFVAGRSLDEWAVDQGLPRLQMSLSAAPPTRSGRSVAGRRDAVERLLSVVARVAEAVHAAHQRGVIHRDLKPGNVRVDAQGEPHVLDFGVAKVLRNSTTALANAPTLTSDGEFVGSLPWAAPEQADPKHGEIGPATDVYALGLILYQSLTGRFPYLLSGGLRDVLDRIVTAEPISPRQWGTNTELDDEIETIILTCLAKTPGRRYSSASDLAIDLRRRLAGQPIIAKRDSRWYLARTRVRSWSRANPTATRLSIAMLATIFAQLALSPLFYQLTPASRLYEQVLLSLLPPPQAASIEQARIIALSDETPVVELARRHGLAGVTPTHLVSLRRLHGRLLERLAAARPASVVLDLFFLKPSEFDEDLCAGVATLRAVGVDVIAGVKNWRLDASGQPELTPRIREQVRWGAISGDFSDMAPWAIELAITRKGRTRGEPSIALEAVAATRHPFLRSFVTLEPEAQRVRLHCFADEGGWEAEYVIPVAGCQQESAPTEAGDLQAGDMTAYLRVVVPPDAALNESIVDYAAVMSADDATLRGWFEGRVAVLGDFRASSGDLHPHPGDRMLAGCVAHACAIDQILRATLLISPSGSHQWLLTLLAAALGVIAAWLAAAAGASRVAVALGIASAWVIAGIAALIIARYLFSPFVPIAAAWVAQALAARFATDNSVRRVALESGD